MNHETTVSANSNTPKMEWFNDSRLVAILVAAVIVIASICVIYFSADKNAYDATGKVREIVEHAQHDEINPYDRALKERNALLLADQMLKRYKIFGEPFEEFHLHPGKSFTDEEFNSIRLQSREYLRTAINTKDWRAAYLIAANDERYVKDQFFFTDSDIHALKKAVAEVLLPGTNNSEPLQEALLGTLYLDGEFVTKNYRTGIQHLLAAQKHIHVESILSRVFASQNDHKNAYLWALLTDESCRGNIQTLEWLLNTEDLQEAQDRATILAAKYKHPDNTRYFCGNMILSDGLSARKD